MNSLLGVLACLLVLPWAAPALAWSDVGHRIICEIAFQELDDTVRERVKAMFRQDPEFDTFAESCSWPDHPRRRASEHYVNLPRDAERLEQAHCPLATGCVVSAIETDLAVLSSSSATEPRLRRASVVVLILARKSPGPRRAADLGVGCNGPGPAGIAPLSSDRLRTASPVSAETSGYAGVPTGN